MMAVTDITAADINTGGLQYIILDVLGNTIGDLFLWCVVIAITVCCLAVHTAAIRMMFAMARDNNLPAGEHLAKIDPRTKTPIIPAVLIGAIAILILVVNIRQPQIFVVVTSIGIILIYIAYLLVTGPMLLARIRGKWRYEDTPEGYFTMGKKGFVVNLLAVIWGAAIAINLAWPRSSIYNATEPFHWYLKWGGTLFVLIVGFGGFAYYWFVQRHKTGTLAAHAHVAEEPAPRRRRRSPAAPSNGWTSRSRRSCAATRRSTRSRSGASRRWPRPRSRRPTAPGRRSSTGRSRPPTAPTWSGRAPSSCWATGGCST